MGRLLKFRLGLAGSALLGILFVAINGDYSNPRREIYFRHHSKFDLSFVFGYLPGEYQNEYRDTVTENGDCRLTDIVYLKHPSQNYNYVLIAKKDNPTTEAILFDSDMMSYNIQGLDDLLSCQIDLSLFNNYLECVSVSERQDVITHFCNFFKNSAENTYFKMVTSTDELTELRKVMAHPGENLGDCYKILHNGFEPDFGNYVYIWFDNLGFFEVSFVMDHTTVRKISDKLIFGPISLNVVATEPCP